MFDDLIDNLGKMKRKINKAMKEDLCPLCGSPDIETVCGVFLSRTRYAQTMECEVCGAQWKIIYDSDLNVVDVETGG